jgi:hypothetical protein
MTMVSDPLTVRREDVAALRMPSVKIPALTPMRIFLVLVIGTPLKMNKD